MVELLLSREQIGGFVKRRIVSALAIAIAGFLLAPSSATSQQKSFKDAVIGNWRITAIYDQYEDGRKNESFGHGAKGTYVFGADGSFTQIIFGEPRPEMKTDEMRQADAFIVAYIGRYTVDESKGTIAYKVERAANSRRDGFEGGFMVQIHGDTASFIGSARPDKNGTFTPHIELQRFK